MVEKMKILILILSIYFFGLLSAERGSYDGYKVWSVLPNTPEQIEKLREWEDVTSIDFLNDLNKVGNPVKIMVAPVSLEGFENFLEQENIPNEIVIENAEEVFEQERKEQEEAIERNKGRSTVDFEHYWTSDEINDYMNHLVNFHGSICRAQVVGHTIQGQLIRVMKISMYGEVDGSRPIIYIDAGVHAREWAAFMSGIYIMHQLCTHPEYRYEFYNVDFIIMPMVNPDGYEYTHSTYRMWRKNRRINSNANCPGVDGNRNYAMGWQFGTNQCSETYSGTAPFSEPEARAVSSVVEEYGSAIKVYVSLHTYGEYVLYPWGYVERSIDHWEQHHELGEIYAAAVNSVGGRNYTIGGTAEVLYIAYGGSNDYMADSGVRLAYTIELTGGPQNGFDLPLSMLGQVLDETWLGFQAIGRYVSVHDWDSDV